MKKETLLNIDRNRLDDLSMQLDTSDIAQLVLWLNEKEDKIRYPSTLVLMQRASIAADVYPFWEDFRQKLTKRNSFVRNIGLMMLAANARWASDDKMAETLDEYLKLLSDEKPVTVRRCIQELKLIIPYHPNLHKRIAHSLMAVDLMCIRESMRKLVCFDILGILVLLCKERPNDEIEEYIVHALDGNILDHTFKKRVREIVDGALSIPS